jgi:hypothetical protein
MRPEPIGPGNLYAIQPQQAATSEQAAPSSFGPPGGSNFLQRLGPGAGPQLAGSAFGGAPGAQPVSQQGGQQSGQQGIGGIRDQLGRVLGALTGIIQGLSLKQQGAGPSLPGGPGASLQQAPGAAPQQQAPQAPGS